MEEEQINNMRFWNEYVDDLMTQYPLYSREELENTIFERMKITVRQALETIPKEYHLNNAVGLMGWDYILDSELNPWLMEINSGPDMKVNISPVGSSSKVQLFTTALELMFIQNTKEEMPNEFHGWMKV